MKDQPSTLQNAFLERLQNEKAPVSVYLMNGIKLQGIIEGFDKHVLILKGINCQMIYKQVISTVLPQNLNSYDFND